MAGKKIQYQNKSVSFVTVTDEHAGRRLDNFLKSYFRNLPKSRIYQMIRRGEVRVNKGRNKQDYHLKIGDNIRIPPIYLAMQQHSSVPDECSKLIKHSIIYEDDNFIVINKPANIAVHGGSNVRYGVIDILRTQRPDGDFLELVHRLDKATSGCLMIAKNHKILRHMHDIFKNGNIKKNYLALLKGHLENTSQIVDLPIYRTNNTWTNNKIKIDVAGKQASTHFYLLERFNTASLAKVELMTGRTHQIRVHAKSIGHPLAGDDKYGDFEFNRAMKKFGLARLFLHAQTLFFTIPDIGKQFKLVAPLPHELDQCLNKLKLNHEY